MIGKIGLPNKLRKRYLFLKRRLLRNISPDYFGPRIVRIYPISYLCNHNCPMCWRSNNLTDEERRGRIALEEQSLKIFEYQRIFKSLPPAVEIIEVVGGGEPLLYPKVEELTRMVKKDFYTGSMITNGVLLNSKMIKHLLKIKWDNIRVSTHASNPYIHQLINGVDTFKVVWNNIRLFLEKRSEIQKEKIYSRLGILFVIQKNNYQDIFNFAKLGQEVGCDYVEFDTVYPYKKNMLLNKREIAQVIDQLQKVTDDLFIENNASWVIDLYKFHPHTGENGLDSKKYYHDKKCIIPKESMVLDSFGNIYPCCFLDNSEPESIQCGSFRKTGDVWSIWKLRRYKKIRRKLERGKFYKTCLSSCNYALPQK